MSKTETAPAENAKTSITIYLLPEHVDWIDGQIAEFRRRGYVETRTGFLRTLIQQEIDREKDA